MICVNPKPKYISTLVTVLRPEKQNRLLREIRMDDNLKQAITFIKSGDKKRGGQLLAEIVKKDPRNLSAWLWLSSCVSNDEQRIYCLKKVLEIDPNHQAALSALSRLQQPEQPSEIEILGRSETHSVSNSQTNQKSFAARKIEKKPSFFKNLSAAEKYGLLIGLIFIVLVVCVVLVKVASSMSNPKQLQQPTTIQLPTQTSIPRIRSSDLSSICINNGELPIGYVATETINNINETEHEDKYKSGIDGYFNTKWEASGYPTIICQLFLYSSSSVASSNFQDMANKIADGPLREQFSLREYGDERIGIVLLLNSPLYVYEYRNGRVIVEINLISDQTLEYSTIDGIVNIVDTKLNQFNTR